MNKLTKQHTQWAGQYYVAAELTRRGYNIAFTLGNTPLTDLLVVSPTNRHLRIECKSQKSKSFWRIKRKNANETLFYVFILILEDPKESPKFWIMKSIDVNKKIDEEVQKQENNIKKGTRKEVVEGFIFSKVLENEENWYILK
ncbi:MAG: hypothetical protein ACTSYA_09650 [Candidatus Kariarchaeaceae archaeon]